MRKRLLRLAAVSAAFGGLLVGTSVSPVDAAPLQGANKFANAPIIQTVGGIFTGDTFGASQEPGEPDHVMNIGGASVWFKWRAIGSGPVRFSTRGSDFDTVLAVYRGSDVAHLAFVRGNDDAEPPARWSRVQFPAVDGVTYRIVIDGYNENNASAPPVQRGNYRLRVINYAQGG